MSLAVVQYSRMLFHASHLPNKHVNMYLVQVLYEDGDDDGNMRCLSKPIGLYAKVHLA